MAQWLGAEALELDYMGSNPSLAVFCVVLTQFCQNLLSGLR